MANDKITIGKRKEKDRKETNPVIINPQEISSNPEQEPVEMQLDENVWGNDYSLVKMMDKDLLAERRLFVRVIFMKKIECYKILDSLDAEPIEFKKPIIFDVTDVSVGGFGIISENVLPVGKFLLYKLRLDEREYEVKGEVVYCFKNGNMYRAGLRIGRKDKAFLTHLKVFVARISLRKQYGGNPLV